MDWLGSLAFDTQLFQLRKSPAAPILIKKGAVWLVDRCKYWSNDQLHTCHYLYWNLHWKAVLLKTRYAWQKVQVATALCSTKRVRQTQWKTKKMPCDLSAIAPFVTFPTLMVSIIHIILRFTLLGLLHAGCWATFSCTEQCEPGLQMRTHRRRGENSSVGRWEEQCWGPQPSDLCAVTPVQQWWGWRERWQFFFARFPTIYYMLFFCNGINPNSLLDAPLCGMITAEYGN